MCLSTTRIRSINQNFLDDRTELNELQKSILEVIKALCNNGLTPVLGQNLLMIGMHGIDLKSDVNNDVLVYASFFIPSPWSARVC